MLQAVAVGSMVEAAVVDSMVAAVADTAAVDTGKFLQPSPKRPACFGRRAFSVGAE